MSARHVSLRRAEAVPDGEGRRCASCGDFIDPIDWCPSCISLGKPCGLEGDGAHRRLRKRADAAFCNAECRAEHRNSYIRNCT